MDKKTTISEISSEPISSGSINNTDEDKSESTDSRIKKIKLMTPMTPQEYEERQRKAMESNEFEIEEATVWEPPQGQTGMN